MSKWSEKSFESFTQTSSGSPLIEQSPFDRRNLAVSAVYPASSVTFPLDTNLIAAKAWASATSESNFDPPSGLSSQVPLDGGSEHVAAWVGVGKAVGSAVGLGLGPGDGAAVGAAVGVGDGVGCGIGNSQLEIEVASTIVVMIFMYFLFGGPG